MPDAEVEMGGVGVKALVERAEGSQRVKMQGLEELLVRKGGLER